MSARPRALISDFGGVLTTPLGNAFAAWSRESGIALEDLATAMVAAEQRHGEHPLFMLEKGRSARSSSSPASTPSSAMAAPCTACSTCTSATSSPIRR